MRKRKQNKNMEKSGVFGYERDCVIYSRTFSPTNQKDRRAMKELELAIKLGQGKFPCDKKNRPFPEGDIYTDYGWNEFDQAFHAFWNKNQEITFEKYEPH